MSKSISEQLMERRAGLIRQAQETAERGVVEGRDLTVEEQTSFDQMIAEADKLHERAKAIKEGEERGQDLARSFKDVTGKDFKPGEQERGSEMSKFGEWARNARFGDAFDMRAGKPGAEARAMARVLAGESRAMSATGGVGDDGVYGQLWEYAVAASQILQSGIQVINTADGNPLPFPVATVHATTSDTAVSANGPLTESDATLTTVENTVSKYAYITVVPSELVSDTTFDLEGYIARSAGRELSRRLGKVASTAATTGYTVAGSTGPVGTSTSLGDQATAGEGSDLLVNLFHSVLPEYRAMGSGWLMADPSAAMVRNLKSTTGYNPWQPALTAGDPDLIMGKPVFIDPNLPSPAASKKTIYFGDWSSLVMRIAGGLRFERSNDYAFGDDQIAFRAIVRCGASVLDTNAVKYFVHSAT